MVLSKIKLNEMKNKKKLSKNDIKKYVKNSYNFQKINKIHSLTHNNINSTIYKISTPDDEYLLRFFTDGVGKFNSTPKKIENICFIQNNCYNFGLNVQQPIFNKKGKFTDPSRNLFITKYYPGSIFSGTPKELRSLSKNLALLHKYLKKQKLQLKSQIDQPIRKILSLKELNIMYDELSDNRTNKFENIFFNNFESIKILIKNHKKNSPKFNLKKTQKQLIHNDLHPHNVIFNQGNVLAFLDFNSMGNGYKIEDIAFASFRFSIHKNQNFRKMINKCKIFVNEYEKFNNITQTEKKLYGYYIRNRLLRNLSYILRVKFFIDKNFQWDVDLTKNLNYLKITSDFEYDEW